MNEKIFQGAKKKKLKIETNNKSYSIKDSSLYNLTKNSLEKQLGCSLLSLDTLRSDDNYRVFMVDGREIQCPKFKLNKIHTRIASLLCRIEMPDFLHSGVKKKSYVTNANAHLGDHPVLTMDISSFFKSISKTSIYNSFLQYFNISPDIAGLLAELCSYNGHLPTGSRISLPLSFWCSKKMYDKLSSYCFNKDIKMTVYVDDITFSGERVSLLVQKHLSRIIHDSGYQVNQKKTRLYTKYKPKQITGVIVNGNVTKVRNAHQRKIHELLEEMPYPRDEEHLDKLQVELLGRLNAAGQVEKRFSGIARSIRNKYIS